MYLFLNLSKQEARATLSTESDVGALVYKRRTALDSRRPTWRKERKSRRGVERTDESPISSFSPEMKGRSKSHCPIERGTKRNSSRREELSWRAKPIIWLIKVVVPLFLWRTVEVSGKDSQRQRIRSSSQGPGLSQRLARSVFTRSPSC